MEIPNDRKKVIFIMSIMFGLSTEAVHTLLALHTFACIYTYRPGYIYLLKGIIQPFLLPTHVWERPIWECNCFHPLCKPAWVQWAMSHPPRITSSVCVCYRRTCVRAMSAWKCVPVYTLLFIKSVRRWKKKNCTLLGLWISSLVSSWLNINNKQEETQLGFCIFLRK